MIASWRMTDFKRALQPEHKEARRQSLMAAATDLFDRSGSTGAGINAIAAQAGFTKSNVYRYFESREHVLLALFLEEFEGFSRAVCPAIQRAAIGDISDVADAITAGFVSRPRLCKLAAILGIVLEQNVSSEMIQEIKIHVSALTEPLVQAISERIPGAAIEDSRWAFAMISSLLAGMWPGVIPSAAAGCYWRGLAIGPILHGINSGHEQLVGRSEEFIMDMIRGGAGRRQG